MHSTIGSFAVMHLDEACSQALIWKRQIKQGEDPREQHQQKIQQRVAQDVGGLVLWQQYLYDRSPAWGKRHLADQQILVGLGGKIITKGLRPG